MVDIKNRKEIFDSIEEIKRNCFTNYPDKEDLNTSCRIENNIEDTYKNNLSSLREDISSICNQIGGIGNKSINIIELLKFSVPDICNQYQIKVEKEISNNFNDYPIQSILNTDISGNQKLYYYSEKDDSVSFPVECNNKVGLDYPVYGENYLSKSQACKNLSVKFVKILNIIGCSLVFLLENSDLIRKDSDDVEPNRSKGVNSSKGIPFFQQQLETIVNNDNGELKINLCNGDHFKLYNGKDDLGNEIKINDILPVSLLKNLYTSYEVAASEKQDGADQGGKRKKKSKKTHLVKRKKMSGGGLKSTLDTNYLDVYKSILEALSTPIDDGAEGADFTVNEINTNEYKLKNFMSKISEETPAGKNWYQNCKPDNENEIIISKEAIEKEKSLSAEDQKDPNKAPFTYLLNNFNLLRGMYLKVVIDLLNFFFSNPKSPNTQVNNLFLYYYQNENIDQCLNNDIPKDTGKDRLFFTNFQDILIGEFTVIDENTTEFTNISGSKFMLPLGFSGKEKGTKLKITKVKDGDTGNEITFENPVIDSKQLIFTVKEKSDGDGDEEDNMEIESPYLDNLVPGYWRINFTIDDSSLKDMSEKIQIIINDFIIKFEDKYIEIINKIYELYQGAEIKFEEKKTSLSGENLTFEVEGLKINVYSDYKTAPTGRKTEYDKALTQIKLKLVVEAKNIFSIDNDRLSISNTVEDGKIKYVCEVANVTPTQRNNLSDPTQVTQYFQRLRELLQSNSTISGLISLSEPLKLIIKDISLDKNQEGLISKIRCGKEEDTKEDRLKRSEDQRVSQANQAKEDAINKAKSEGETDKEKLDMIGQQAYNSCYSDTIPATTCDSEQQDIVKQCKDLFDQGNFSSDKQNICKPSLELCKDQDFGDIKKADIQNILDSDYYKQIQTISVPSNLSLTSEQRKCIQDFNCGEKDEGDSEESFWKKCSRKYNLKFHPDKTGCETQGRPEYEAVQKCNDNNPDCSEEDKELRKKCIEAKDKWETLKTCSDYFSGSKSGTAGLSGCEIESNILENNDKTNLTLNFDDINLDDLTPSQIQSLKSSIIKETEKDTGISGNDIQISLSDVSSTAIVPGGKRSTKKKKYVKKAKKSKKQTGGKLQVKVELRGMTSVIEKINTDKLTEKIKASQLNTINQFKEESIDSEDCSSGNSNTCRRILGPKNTDGSSRGCILKDTNCVPLPSKEDLSAITDCSQGTPSTCNSIGGPNNIGCNLDSGICVENKMIDEEDCSAGNNDHNKCIRIKGPENWRDGPGKGCEWVPEEEKGDKTSNINDGKCQVRNLQEYEKYESDLKNIREQQEIGTSLKKKQNEERESLMTKYQQRKDVIDACIKPCQKKCGFSIQVKSTVDIDSPGGNKDAVINTINQEIAKDLNIPPESVFTNFQGGKVTKNRRKKYKRTQKGSGIFKQKGGEQFEVITTINYPPTEDSLGGKTAESLLQEKIGDINETLSSIGANVFSIIEVNKNPESSGISEDQVNKINPGTVSQPAAALNNVNVIIPLEKNLSDKISSSTSEIRQTTISELKSFISTQLNVPEENVSVNFDFSTGGRRKRRKISSKRGIKKYKKIYQIGGGYSLNITVIPSGADQIDSITQKLQSQETKDLIFSKINDTIPDKESVGSSGEPSVQQSGEPSGQGGKIKKNNKRITKSKISKKMIGGNNSEVPIKNCAMSSDIKCCVDNSLRNVQTANKPIYYGSINQPFNTAINIAKNLQPNNENLSWSKWELNNIGGKRSIKKYIKKTKLLRPFIKKTKKLKK
jgi:uncharacterized protein YqgV (UPF0045/DUF77 family)